MNQALTGIAGAAPAIAMLAAIVCLAGGVYMVARRRERLKGVLMIVMALVLVGNVLIWTL